MLQAWINMQAASYSSGSRNQPAPPIRCAIFWLCLWGGALEIPGSFYMVVSTGRSFYLRSLRFIQPVSSLYGRRRLRSHRL